MFPIS